MLSKISATPTIYTGPLTTSLGDGVTESEGRALLHAARVMLGQAVSAADTTGQISTSSWHTFENGITVRVARLGGQHIAEFVRHPVAELPDPTVYDGFALIPYGGVIVDGYLTNEKLEGYPSDEAPEVELLDRFSPSAKTLVRLDNIRKQLEKQLAKATDPDRIRTLTNRLKYIHGRTDYGLKKVPYLHIPVPSQWSSLYNNPVVSLTGTPKVYSQHRLIKPTMFSGKMRIVVQLLMGLGTQKAPKMKQQLAVRAYPDDSVALETYRRDMVDEDRSKYDLRLGSIDYWFLWHKTHGVYTTDGGRHYLIQIDNTGVWAMRLPVLAMSQWAMPDDAKPHLRDMPLGFSFPAKDITDKEKESPWDKAIKEGWVRQLLTAEDMAPFYDKLKPTYLECGWAFSLSGKKADNVGWRYNAPRPYDFPVVEHWSIEISGGDAGPKPLNVYDYNHRITKGYDRSIKDMVARIRRVGKGNAVDIAQYHKPFKVPTIDPDTGIPGVISFDMAPAGWPTKGPPPPDYQKAWKTYPVSDTVVHVFYDDEELVWVRFYNPLNKTEIDSDSWDDRDDPPYCMLLGAYTWGSFSRPLTLPKGFYSSRGDPRKMADESRTELQSQGKKTWESPYMGIVYSWPYPPYHFGYEASNDSDDNWWNGWDPSYTSAVGSPWTGKRHCFHVRVWGDVVTGQQYSYACAIPMTDREAAFICERHIAETHSKVNYQYAAMVMQYVYYTYPSWIPDPRLGGGIPPQHGLAWWELRDDTVKRLVWRFFSDDQNYTKEKLQPVQTVLNVVSGTHTAPVDIWDRGTTKQGVEDYTVTTLCSALGGEYPHEMKAGPGANALWEDVLPSDTGYLIAHFWCTRSVVGMESSKMHIYLNGGMSYTGLRADKLLDFDKASPHRQVTFVGET